MYKFDQRSIDNLKTCHPDLQVIGYNTAIHRNCSCLSGQRGQVLQDYLYSIGASTKKWPNSDHNSEPYSNAFDLAPYQSTVPHINWEDRSSFIEFSGYTKAIADALGTPIGNGYDWDLDLDFTDQTFMDGAHFWLLKPREITSDMLELVSKLFDYE